MSADRTRSWEDLLGELSPEARARVEARVRDTLESLPLAELRRALGCTQVDLAARLEISQGSVSKLERQVDWYLSTLRRYVSALGGELQLVARFPDGRAMEIGGLADGEAGDAA